MLESVRISTRLLNDVLTHNIHQLLEADHQYVMDERPYAFL